MQSPRGLREAGSKNREQRGHRFDGIGLLGVRFGQIANDPRWWVARSMGKRGYEMAMVRLLQYFMKSKTDLLTTPYAFVHLWLSATRND